jgi:FemAB-related protein (PEP-CTERM system-associated)
MHYSVALIEGEVVGVLPVVTMSSRLFGCFGVSMPYFNYGGPIGDAEGIVDALIKVSEQQAVQSKLQHIEHRGLKPLPQYPGHNNKVSMWLELPETSESLWQALGAKVRAQVNKAKPHGLTAHSGGAELLDDFYRVFAINMRDLGTPVYAKSFFQNVLDTEIGSKQIVLLKNSQGEPVSAAFLMGYKGQLEVPWASTLKKANHTNANMMLYWHMLKYACDECYKVFDFGRSSVDASTFKFKKQWGAKPVQLHWHYWLANGGELPQLNPSNPKYKMVIWLWQKLPVWLTRLIGPLIVKNLP